MIRWKIRNNPFTPFIIGTNLFEFAVNQVLLEHYTTIEIHRFCFG